MFYYIGHIFPDDLICFVFDDSDNSVELIDYVKVKDLVPLDRVISNPPINGDSGEWTKLRVCGFSSKYDGYLVKNIVEYSIDGVAYILKLGVYADSSCYAYLSSRIGDGSINAEAFEPKTTMEYRYISASSDSIMIKIPTKMLFYMLNLRGSNRFEDLMICLGDFYGHNIHELVYNIQGKSVKFRRWL